MRSFLSVLASFLLITPVFSQPGPTGEFVYPYRILPDSTYDTSIPSPESILGFGVGDRAAFPSEIVRVFETMADASPKAVVFEHARTHEGLPAIHMAISSADNIARLDEIKAARARLADPRGLSDSEADELVSSVPVVAWFGYSIHGDELSGADASMLVAYHLIASRSDEVSAWLDDMVVLLVPMQNPDGRQRWLSQIAQHRGVSPNVDDQSLLHAGYWPWGRTNHYHFDLNRDWIFGVHPESRGRVRTANSWHPLLFVDAHEMGAQNTYMFSPDAEPLNSHFPEYLNAWQENFGKDQAAAFDVRGWPYWNGFPFDNWYPGYGSSWGKIIGAVAILYEQAGFDEDGIRRPEGSVITYYEAIHHQAVSTWTNLRTLFENRETLQRGFLSDRRTMVDASGPYANRSWAILPTENASRLHKLIDILDLQGIEYGVAESSFVVRAGRDMLGRSFQRREIPAGSILISNRQPAGRAAATLLNFDERLSEEILRKERKSLLDRGSGRMYDVTAWNLLMYHGLDALQLDQDVPVDAAPYLRPPQNESAELPMSSIGYAVNNTDDAVVAFAARLMERNIHVRVGMKDSEVDGKPLQRGSIVVLNTDNRPASDDGLSFSEPSSVDLREIVDRTATELGLEVRPLRTMQSPGELPELGNSLYRLLQKPQIALVARRDVSRYDFGSIWYAIDHELGVRHSHLDSEYLSSRDLRRYNVIVLPDRSGSWEKNDLDVLEPWVRNGGTLIAVGRSAYDLSKQGSRFSKVRQLRDVLHDLDDYETTILREWEASNRSIPDVADVWSYAAPGDRKPWTPQYTRPDTSKLRREDVWRRVFMPQTGAMVAARTNAEHWLAFGTGDNMSVLFEGDKVLMAKYGIETAVRAGVYVRGDGPQRVGWSAVPEGQQLVVRKSGLLWPEAVQRLANGALVTRERLGKGQVILIGFQPNYRGSTSEGRRVLLNALVLGPGAGTSAVVEP